jgi:hypothetical protein
MIVAVRRQVYQHENHCHHYPKSHLAHVLVDSLQTVYHLGARGHLDPSRYQVAAAGVVPLALAGVVDHATALLADQVVAQLGAHLERIRLVLDPEQKSCLSHVLSSA